MPKLIEAPVEVPGTKKLTGTFTFPPPMCIGEPFIEANKRGGKDERSKGKQLISGPMRGTIAFPGNFSTIPFLCSDGKQPYLENNKYKDIFKDKPDKKKLGFLTSDFPKRDEFSNVMRTEQLRACLKAEVKTTRESEARIERIKKEQGVALNSSTLSLKDPMETQHTFLYDVVNRAVPTSLRLQRDDRQARLFYMEERKRLKQLASSGAADLEQTHRTATSWSEPKWINISVNGKIYDVLADPQGNVLTSKLKGDSHTIPSDSGGF